jgi:hypothetical protein
MADIATLGLRINADGLIKALSDTELRLNAVGTKALDVGKKFGVAFGAAAVGGLVLTIKNTIEQEKVLAQLEARVRSTGGAAGFTSGALAQMAGDLQKVSTFGDEAIISMQSVLLTFTQVRGDEFKGASQAILDMSTALGMDLKSAALQVGKALNDPILGVSALARAGVQLTASQKEAVKSLVEVGDVAGAQRIILKELETQFGGAAAAARNTLGGALVSLKNAFGDLFEVPSLISPITDEINRLTRFLGDPSTIEAVKGFIQFVVVNFAAAASVVVNAVGLISTALGQMTAVFGKLTGPESAINRAARALDGVAKASANGLVTIDAIAAGFASNGRAASTATPSVRGLAGAIDEVGTAATDAGKPLGELTNQYGLFIKEIKESEAAAKKAATAFPEMVVEMQKVQEVILPSEGALTAWETFAVGVQGVFRSIGEWAKASADQIADSLLSTFRTIAQRGKATLGDLFATLGGAGVGGATGASIFSGLAIVTDAFKGFGAALKAERDRIARELEAYRATLEGFANSVNEMLGLTAFESGIDRLSRQFSDLWGNLFDQMSRDARGVLTTPSGGRMTADQARSAASATTNVGLAQELLAYADELDRLNGLFKTGVAELERRRKVEIESLEASITERELRAQGRNEEADAIRQRIKEQTELNEAIRLGMPQELIDRLEQLFELERQRVEELEEAARNRTLAGLDAEIARAGGDEAEARRIERDIILADVTDELIRAKYEELFAIQDAARATQELADAMALLENQNRMMEDLEVRRLVATGNSIEAEELRFRLGQEREARQAERDLALGLITQEIFETLLEILDLEKDFFNQQRQAPPETGTAASNRPSASVGQISSLATAQVQDIDRVVGELTTIRIRSGQTVQLLQQLIRGGGILGALNKDLQFQTNSESRSTGNKVFT